MESKPVIVAKATTGDSTSPVVIVDGNSSQQKVENTPVTTAEATSDFILLLEPVVGGFTSVPQASFSPSFERSNGRWIRDTIEFNVSGNIVIIAPRASGSEKKPKDDEEIPEEQAVCKFCFDKFAEENVLKTKCNCKTGLVHDKCASHHFTELGNNMCEVCDQEVETIPVTLLRRPFSTKKNEQESFVSRLKRVFWSS